MNQLLIVISLLFNFNMILNPISEKWLKNIESLSHVKRFVLILENSLILIFFENTLYR